MTRDVRDIKKRVNQLIEIQIQQLETLAHVILILNITRYVMQFKRQHINAVMEVVGRTHNDITTLFNIMSSIYTHINYQQILLHICSPFWLIFNFNFNFCFAIALQLPEFLKCFTIYIGTLKLNLKISGILCIT